MLHGSTAYLSLAYLSLIAGCGRAAASENSAIRSFRHGVRLEGAKPVTADSLSHCNRNRQHWHISYRDRERRLKVDGKAIFYFYPFSSWPQCGSICCEAESS